MDPAAEPEPASPPPPTDTERRRVTVKEMRERIELLRRKLLTGIEPRALRLLAAAEFGLSARQARWYVQTATREIREAVQRDKDSWLAEHLAHRRDLRRRANESLDLRTELAAAESEAKLLGLEPPQELKHQFTAKDGAPRFPTELVIEYHIPAAPAPDRAGDDRAPGPVDTAAEHGPAGLVGRDDVAGPVPPGPKAGLDLLG